MNKEEMLAMLLAGGQGSRLGILTKQIAKPAVMFGGKYRIIDFPLSNCINSGIDTVGVLTQYEPLLLTKHIGIGIPWDLDRKTGGVTILPPFLKKGNEGSWYSGTANAIYHNIRYIDEQNPEYILILSGDHVYKMDYSAMLEEHKKNQSDATIAVIEVPLEMANQFGIMNTNEAGRIIEFEEKPASPKSNLASMGIYIFTWEVLKEALIKDNAIHSDSDFGKHIIPDMINTGKDVYAYHFNDYWRDIGTIEAYWKANMELTDTVPIFNLYDEFSKIYTNIEHQLPQYMGKKALLHQALISEGCEIYGQVYNSVLGPRVIIEEGATVHHSIIMADTVIKKNAHLEKCIISEKSQIGENTQIGVGENIVHITKPYIYSSGITVIGDNTIIPDNITIGKNCEIGGHTLPEHYPNGKLESGHSLII
ncbi:glucose-1-phosphate adenylyltransferase [Sporanaerobium hydrogeniformans]|uniref:Glucose-1-phosphate adenylyltransferase n=1 Tax=Sporanaerobium hydrogeniformans TaxID=3072179 RepID=A0AC61DC93_9FIRM|nr:glucose-1-phosphate adenylyltransferase [Sporanaerobium hydrogeniformans]PHV70378.1 glucose-1-phosphate adenylyltransferase [Sporanaerobium hydrogeniformans]